MGEILTVIFLIALGLVLLRIAGIFFRILITAGLVLLIMYVISEAASGAILPLLTLIR